MGRIKLQATTEVTQTVALKNAQMVLTRLEEHARLGKEIKERKGRQERIRDEVQDIFVKEKQGKALANGTELGGHKLKLVTGKRKVFDQQGFMKKHGLTQADFDEFTDYNDNEPYIKLTAPGEKDE